MCRPDEESVERGQALVEAVLNPYSDDAISQKEQQMRELAQINGTLKEDDKGVDPSTWGNTAAKGALFNPARGGGAASGPVTMDDEYASFMAELGGGGPPGPPKIDSAELAAQVETKPPRTPLPDWRRSLLCSRDPAVALAW